ncbi:MAG: ABC transporter permease [Dehalococcoidia bacterium]|nr:ABC transporter permease [Dehalococcoidia bacterium]
MQSEATILVAPNVRKVSGPGVWARWILRFMRQKPLGGFGLVFIVILVLTALFAPVIAPHDYSERTGAALADPSADHLMGTDKFGRDLFSRIVYGSRATVKIGLGAAALATATALVIGMTSGFIGGWYDTIVQRLVETIMSLPGIVIVLSVVAFAGGGETTTLLVLGFLAAPGMSRVIRGATIQVRDAQYIEAARAVSASTPRLILRHTLPNIVAPTVVVGTLAVGNAILAEAALSFLGFGVNPPTPSWGQELNASGRTYFQIAPHLAIFPGVAISLAVFSFNMLGDALRDVLDPRLRNT